jgi:CheY-like chemotaxis protein
VLQPVAVDAADMLRSLADLLRRTLDQRIRIEVDVPAHPLEVLVDPGQLESALLNIAINSRDAMPGGGTLRFRAERCDRLPDKAAAESEGSEAGFVAIAVTDTGNGMSAEVRERAFEPFFTTKEAGRGTGLGLSTVYGFTRQSRGAVTLDSAPGQGTTLTLYLPLPRDAAAPAAKTTPSRSIRPGRPVLLVEDDTEVRAVMRRFLDAFGCLVSEAPSAEQALLVIGAGHRFDILLTDIALGPGMRGTELAARVQEQLPTSRSCSCRAIRPSCSRPTAARRRRGSCCASPARARSSARRSPASRRGVRGTSGYCSVVTGARQR